MGESVIGAIVVAAGLSRRMGEFKLLLPWGNGTVIGRVVRTLAEAGLAYIVVVVGHRGDEVAEAVSGTAARTLRNARYAEGEMLSSVQAGLEALSGGMPQDIQGSAAATGARRPGECAAPPARPDAVLLCLGDQPQMLAATVATMIAAARADGCRRILVPSYNMRAGHPTLLPRWLWPEILAAGGDLRRVLRAHPEHTHYLVVDTPTVLADLDTAEDYKRWQPASQTTT